jgi:hypothetical protein
MTSIATDDKPPIEADTGIAPQGMLQRDWDRYVIETIRRWRKVPFPHDEPEGAGRDDPRIPF